TEAGEALETPGGGLQASGYPEAGPGQSTRSRRGTATDRHRKDAPCVGRGPFRYGAGVQRRLPVMGDQIAEVERRHAGQRSARVADPAREYEDRDRKST